MEFHTYEIRAGRTAIYPGRGGNFFYPALGLCGEAGEVAEKVKKIYRDKAGVVTSDEQQAMGKELGDVLWYVAALCFEFGLSMNYIAEQNLEKLAKRAETGKLQGSGDDR